MSFLYIFIIIIGVFSIQLNRTNGNFSTYYTYLWGSDHFSVNPQGTDVQLKFDKTSGAGFGSKLDYGSGWFHIRMKIPHNKSGGIVPNIYLTSLPSNQPPANHFEIDYEFLGTYGTIQTNIYLNDGGHREQSFKLWFDPSQDFHSYDILWNSHQIVFYIDKIPIRVFKNNMNKGIPYPNRPMHIEASIWNADWAGKVDWSQSPFISYYQDFDFSACRGDVSQCGSNQYIWNKPEYWELNLAQKRQMDYYRKKYITYDYCSKPSTAKPECSFN